ncbi:Protein-export membrane protein SecG [Fundidesulfovibrio magnetotacticus]|uniref:Protein-export membrane protein SecG n=1 Tax=Fundidesulfovibrio magnetotacticus TaxID=2730080 RepID=A0A6V8LW88_9BACT|nr:preprotein translocase subunit SecG [Fundidesulfovibrio magnetotacticus]GFK94329.1 Protein-export membrane protein SecG [Fundidesulfovibrio magnetotacticus]
MDTLIATVHVIACLALVLLVLLQSGKEGMGVIFGGGSGSVFGSTGAGGLLVKLTAGFGALFLATSLGYNILISQGRKPEASVMDKAPVEQQAAPAENKRPNLFEEAKESPAQPK